jgi:hypothetical protein
MDDDFAAAVRALHRMEDLLAVVDPEVEDVVLAETIAAMARLRSQLWRHGHPRVDHVDLPWLRPLRRHHFTVLRSGAA